MHVGVVGAGTMGTAISAMFANAGYRVFLIDINERALKNAKEKHMSECLEELDEAGLRKRDEIISMITYSNRLDEVESCEFVIEAIVERLPAKIELFEKLEKIVTDSCIVATNTSSFKPSELAIKMERPERFTLFHFSNPPILRKIVEVGGEVLSEENLQKVLEIVKSIGKEPIVLKKDSRGHIFNRVLCSAVAALSWDFGKFTPPAIDVALKNLGSPVGFFELIDYVGIDVLLMVQNSLLEAHGRRFALSDGFRWLLEKMNEWGKLGKKTNEGFYRWKNRRAEIPEAEPADILPMVSAAINEAFREVEEQLADEDTVNKACSLALGSPIGVIDLAKMLGYATVLEILEKKYTETGSDTFKPCKTLRCIL
ncbi:MAG: 3-hydroxyacyl-CoA dehydrogenase [Archaeoglobaceae archaeon]|nr:3-hydroxyacyl-CoA dehydrogenase [Archaeoglobaceae archaeon]